MASAEPEVSLKDFLNSCTDIHEDTTLSFENVGEVCLTTVARANLALLRRALGLGYKGIIVSCPDFEREALAITFLGALHHLVCDEGDDGLCEAEAGMRVALGKCVLDVIDANGEAVRVKTANANRRFIRNKWPSWVHRAKAGAELTRAKGSAIQACSNEYERMPGGIRLLLDICGKKVPSVGYVSSPSPYLNEPPTRVLGGKIDVDGDEARLPDAMHLAYLTSTDKVRDAFNWPFDAPPSVLVGPRPDGMGSAYRLVEHARLGGSLDFVSMNLPGPEFMGTSLLTDIHDLANLGIGVICFCDRWTLDAVRGLKEDGFLLFDWDDCEVATRADYPILSRVQWTMRERRHETVVEVPAGESGIEEAKAILYDRIDREELGTDDALHAKQELFRVLGSAIRMTEAPDEDYSDRMQRTIRDAVEDIEASWSLSREAFADLRKASEALLRIYEPGNVLPKESKVREIVEERLADKKPTVLVVDRSRTEWVNEYWRRELGRDGYETGGFRVISTKEFMAESGLRGNDGVIFSGWYGRDVMDRALHSGIVADMTFVLYKGEGDGLEVEWWRRANDRWHRSSDRCARETDETLARLGIERIGRPAKAKGELPSEAQGAEEKRDDSPAAIVTEIERRRLEGDFAQAGERAVAAIPVMFDDGSHVWLWADPRGGSGGRLVVINDCLTGQNDEPEHKPANAIMRGDMVLRTHSDRSWIRKASMERHEGYQDVMDVARRWREPIQAAQSRGLSKSEVVGVLAERFGETRSVATIRGWVNGERVIAPQSENDIRGIYEAFHIPTSDEYVRQIARAAGRIRGLHQKTGIKAAERMVHKFIEDVREYGLDDALAGFDARHESGNVELLTVSAVGEAASVASERVEVL